jgi:diguanylate cyclase (GGDEF)-like protein
MRLIGRNDLFLLAGLGIALFAITSRSIGQALVFAQEVERSMGLQLLPGLVILAGVFVFHLVQKRHEAREEALAASTELRRQATARAAEMERLVELGRALAQSLTYESVRAAAVSHIPTLTGGRECWAMVRTATHWRRLVVTGDIPLADCERSAQQALGETVLPRAGIPNRNDVTFPMIVGGEPIGVVGVGAYPPLEEEKRGVLAAAAAMLAVSLKNAELFQVVHENSVRDSLTGCFNRTHAMEVIDSELRRSRRSHLPLTLIMFDMDHFKQINDGFGHLCGDAVLADVGQRMNAVLRGSDVKCRYGGEEFLILLPDTTPAGARRVAELLRTKLEERPVRWNNVEVPVTASFGLAGALPGELDVKAIIGRADAALYRAKQTGRNRICSAEEVEALA